MKQTNSFRKFPKSVAFDVAFNGNVAFSWYGSRHHHQAYEVLLNENMDTIRDADGTINTTVIQLALDLNKPIVILGEAVAGFEVRHLRDWIKCMQPFGWRVYTLQELTYSSQFLLGKEGKSVRLKRCRCRLRNIFSCQEGRDIVTIASIYVFFAYIWHKN